MAWIEMYGDNMSLAFELPLDCEISLLLRGTYSLPCIRWNDEIQIDHQLKSAQWVYQSFE